MAQGPPAGESREREQILATLAEVTAEIGYRSVTIEAVIDRAGLDRAAFERHFAGLDDCLAAAWDRVDAELQRRMSAAYRQHRDDWRDGLRSALGAALRYLGHNQGNAGLYFSDAVYVDDRMRERQLGALACLAATIDLGRRMHPEPDRTPRQIADAVAGAIWSRVHRLVRLGHGDGLQDELPQLMFLVVMPYLGTDAAEAELGRPGSG